MIRNRKAAEAALKQLAHLTGLLHSAAAARDAELLKVREEHEPIIRSIEADITLRREELQVWSDANRKQEFGDEQTLELPTGTLWYRQGPLKLLTYSDWDEDRVLGKVLSYGESSAWNNYIKRSPKMDWQKLLADAKGDKPKLSAAKLRQIGLRLDRDEKFHAEPKPELTVMESPVP